MSERPRWRLVSCGLLALLLCGCRQTLYADLDERDANEMLAALLSHGVDAEKTAGKKNRFALRVADGDLAAAVRLLQHRGLPRERAERVGDIFRPRGLLASPLEQRGRYLYALSQSIQDMLAQIDGVISARVNVVLPDNDPLADALRPSSAAVLIKYRPDSQVDRYKADIKMIVAKSIEGLSYDKVSLLLVPAQPPAAPAAGATAAGATPPLTGLANAALLLLFAAGGAAGLLALARRCPAVLRARLRAGAPAAIDADDAAAATVLLNPLRR